MPKQQQKKQKTKEAMAVQPAVSANPSLHHPRTSLAACNKHLLCARTKAKCPP